MIPVCDGDQETPLGLAKRKIYALGCVAHPGEHSTRQVGVAVELVAKVALEVGSGPYQESTKQQSRLNA